MLFSPESQTVMTGVVFRVKSKKGSLASVMLQSKPKICPPANVVDVDTPYSSWAARISSICGVVASLDHAVPSVVVVPQLTPVTG